MASEHNWAEARADATRVGNFLQSLALAQKVFTEVIAAEAQLVRLLEAIAEAKTREGNAVLRMDAAKTESEVSIFAAKEAATTAEADLQKMRRDVAGKCQALEEEAERDRQAFVKFTQELAREHKSYVAAHRVTMSDFAAAEEVARASMERVQKQRRDMIDDLSGKETNDAPA